MKKRVLSLLLVTVMAVTAFAGCGQTEEKKSTQTSTNESKTPEVVETSGDVEKEVAYEDLPTINVLFNHGYDYEGDDNPIWREVAKRIGAKVHFIGADTDKYNAMLASGEGFDLIMALKGDMASIATGGTLLSLDELITEKAPDIAENYESFITRSKEIYSDDSNSLYWLPTAIKHLGKAVGSKEARYGMIRWDLYAKLGYPEMNSVDDLLQVLADMQALQPVNEAGEKVYGMLVTTKTSGASCHFLGRFLYMAGMSNYSQTGSYSWEDMSYTNVYGENGVFWDGVEFTHKAYLMGLLDPDSFIASGEELNAKAHAGRLLYINLVSDHNPAKMPEGTGFATVPLSWASTDATEVTQSSTLTFDYGIGINKKSEYVDQCVKYLDFILSEEGANLIYNGIEGVHYTVDENGVRTMTAEAIELYKDQTAWKEAGLGSSQLGHFVGIAKDSIASDGKAMFLALDSSMFVETLTDTQKDFCEYYGVEYPAQAHFKNAEENNLPQMSDIDGLAKDFFPALTDEVSRLQAAVIAEADALVADLVMCDESEFEAKLSEAKKTLAKAGVTELEKYFNENWETAIKEAENYR